MSKAVALKGVDFIDGRRVVRSKDGTILKYYDDNQADDCFIPTKIYCGTWFGVKLYTHFWLVLLMLGVIIIESALNFHDGKMLGFTFIWSAVLWISVLWHVVAQCILSKALGGSPETIVLWPFGNLTYQCPSKNSGTDLLIALAGPGAQFPLVLAFGIPTVLYGYHDHVIYNNLDLDSQFGQYLVVQLFAMQIIIFLFNTFIPAFPMDAGRIFLDLMLLMNFPIMKAARVCFWYNIVVIIAWMSLLIYAWVDNDGGQARIMSLCTLIWIMAQNVSLYFAMKSEDDLLRNPMFVPYKSWQEHMGDIVTQAETAEAQTNAFSQEQESELPAINHPTFQSAAAAVPPNESFSELDEAQDNPFAGLTEEIDGAS